MTVFEYESWRDIFKEKIAANDAGAEIVSDRLGEGRSREIVINTDYDVGIRQAARDASYEFAEIYNAKFNEENRGISLSQVMPCNQVSPVI